MKTDQFGTTWSLTRYEVAMICAAMEHASKRVGGADWQRLMRQINDARGKAEPMLPGLEEEGSGV